MKQGFIDWNPNAASRERLKTIGAVLREYAADDITLTLRQLYYQLVSKNIIANRQREYKNLGELLSKARLAGLIDWNSIEDRARRAVECQSFDSIQQCVEEAAAGFMLPRWNDQPNYVELWCEKDALSSVIRPICDELFATLMVQRGYGSTSSMYASLQRIERNRFGEDGADRPVHIIYLGDFDPSGEDMVRDIRDRLATFGTEVEVTKLALNPDQIKRWNLPPNPAKMSDSRAQGFVDKHGSLSYEVDAIPPKDLQKLIRSAIKAHMDIGAYNATIDREAALRTKLIAAVAHIK